jgi:hydrogenase/urease accessory protein HupE
MIDRVRVAAGIRLTIRLGTYLVCFAPAVPALAHDARPLSIMIIEQQERTYRVDVRIPPSVEASNRPEISFAGGSGPGTTGGCSVHSGGVREVVDAALETMLVGCASSLEGQRIGVRYKLFNPSISTLLRFSPAAGDTRTAVLPPDQTEWLVPPAANWRTVARDYLLLGVEHIWAGIDHLFFVTGLLLLAKTARRITIAVTGFTLAHSVTLSLSALGLVRLPVAPIEAAIALSILFLAREVARPNPGSLARRFPLGVSCTFGLLHGFGFAAALSSAGLPRNEVAAALLFFNAGVEVGQLAFIAAVLVLIAAAAACGRRTGFRSPSLRTAQMEMLAGYGLGIPAAFWFIERLQSFWIR